MAKEIIRIEPLYYDKYQQVVAVDVLGKMNEMIERINELATVVNDLLALLSWKIK